MNTFKTGAG